MLNKIKAGIIGAAGYTGGEMMRLLLNHPFVEITGAHSKSNAGKTVASVHQDLAGETELTFAADIPLESDVLFLCLGHGDSKNFLEENEIPASVAIIDLSQDFRLSTNAVAGNRNFVYGLPEVNREKIRVSRNIANPGCFATAIQLGLLPLAKAGLLEDIYTTGITGSTGAGQTLATASHFSWRANNIQAYKSLQHQHAFEIGETLAQLQPAKDIDLSFVPWRGDFTRGIFISSQLKCNETLGEVIKLFTDYYAAHPFVTVSKEPVFLKQVVNTNKAMIQIEQVGTKLVVHSAIDNLLKGASGQAVQNMNLVFGLEETAGLKLKANYF
jgi:N-acetyl-gamma-glutamyl-phosphate reductase